MVSPPHEAMHRIFQHDPGLFSRVSQVLGIAVPPPSKVTVMPTDLTETSPVERRVDTLLRLESAERDAFLLAVEAQGKKDPAKPASWAYYVSYLWTKYRLPTALLVVCQDHATARWAERPVSSGPPRLPTLTLAPVVAGPHNMPLITDPDEARGDLALATLAAITHATNPDIGSMLKALSTALRDVPEDVADPIIELTAQGLGDRPAKHLWRNLVAVDLSFYTSWLSQEIREEVCREIRKEVREEISREIRAEVSQEIRAEVSQEVRKEVSREIRAEVSQEVRKEVSQEVSALRAAEDVLLVLEQRALDVPYDVRRRITACTDPEALRHWLARAVTASSAEEIFKED